MTHVEAYCLRWVGKLRYKGTALEKMVGWRTMAWTTRHTRKEKIV